MDIKSLDFQILVEMFLLLLIGVGPKIALVPFIEASGRTGRSRPKRRVAHKMITHRCHGGGLARVVGRGAAQAAALHRPARLSVARGIILLIIAVSMVPSTQRAGQRLAARLAARGPDGGGRFPARDPTPPQPGGYRRARDPRPPKPGRLGCSRSYLGILALVLAIDVGVFRWANGRQRPPRPEPDARDREGVRLPARGARGAACPRRPPGRGRPSTWSGTRHRGEPAGPASGQGSRPICFAGPEPHAHVRALDSRSHGPGSRARRGRLLGAGHPFGVTSTPLGADYRRQASSGTGSHCGRRLFPTEKGILLMRKWLPMIIFASAQFAMVLDSSVMNVAISQIVKDLHTTVQGVQTAITLYTLVMAAFMLLGAKVGDILGHQPRVRDRAGGLRSRVSQRRREPEPGGAAGGLVGRRGVRRSPGDSGDRGADRRDVCRSATARWHTPCSAASRPSPSPPVR